MAGLGQPRNRLDQSRLRALLDQVGASASVSSRADDEKDSGDRAADATMSDPSASASQHSSVTLAAWAGRVRNDDTMDPIQRVFWQHLMKSREHRSFNWDTTNPYRPWKSFFEFLWWMLYLSGEFTTEQFDLIRKSMLVLMHQGVIVGVTKKNCRTARAMRRLCKVLCPLPDALRSEHPGSPTIRLQKKNRARFLSMQSSGAFSSQNDGSEEEKMDEDNVEVVRTPVTWWWSLCMLIPNGIHSVNRWLTDTRDFFDEGSEVEVQSILQTPMVRHWRTLTKCEWLLIRPGCAQTSRLLLEKGRIYQRGNTNEYAMICDLNPVQLQEWLEFRDQPESGHWNGEVHDQRPYWKIKFVCISQRAGAWILDDAVHQILFGEKVKRKKMPEVELEDKSWFQEWSETDGSFRMTQIQYVRRSDGSLTMISESERRRLQAFHLCEDDMYPELNDEQTVPLLMFLGFDAYSATGFASSTSSIQNFYVRCVNNTFDSSPYQLYSASNYQIPTDVVLEQFWKEMSVLNTGLPTLVALKRDSGVVDYEVRTMKSHVLGAVMDMENLDPFMQSVNAQANSRVQGSFYRGCDDPLSPEQSFGTLEPTEIKNRDFWLRTCELVLNNRRCTVSHINRMCTAEGISRRGWTSRWLPDSQSAFNPIVQGIADVAHDFDKLFTAMRINIVAGLEDKEETTQGALAYLDTLAKRNPHLQIPADPLGLKQTGKSNFRMNYFKSFLFYVSFKSLQPDNKRLGILRKGLHCYVNAFACRSGKQVREFQEMVRDFLNGVHEHYQGVKPNLHIPKARDLIRLAFIVIPLFRACAVAEGLRLESAHRSWKRLIAEHSNFKKDFLWHTQVRARELLTYEYYFKGGRTGPAMNLGISEQMINLRDPSDPTKSLFRPPEILGFGAESVISLRFDSVSQKEIDKEKRRWKAINEDVLSGFLRRVQMEIHDSGDSSEILKMWWVNCSRISDVENSVILRTGNAPWILCMTCEPESEEYDCFVMRMEECIKMIRMNQDLASQRGKMDVESNKSRILMAVYGEVFTLHCHADWHRRQTADTCEDPADWYFDTGITSDSCGRHWIPGCCILSPAIVDHVCGKSGHCKVGTDGWECNTGVNDRFQVFHAKWLWRPSLFQSNPVARCIENERRPWKLTDMQDRADAMLESSDEDDALMF